MAKHYIIPIDANHIAYFGVKAATNPYNSQPYGWCAGCPNPFGGNGTNVATTLLSETQQESHNKVALVQASLALPPAGHLIVLHTSGTGNQQMTFYGMRGHFTVNLLQALTPAQNAQPSYHETTGQLVTVNLNTINTTDAASTAQAVCNASPNAANVSQQAVTQFLASETATAIREAALRVQNNQI